MLAGSPSAGITLATTIASALTRIITGYSESSGTAKREKVSVIALDSDPERVRQAAAAGDSVVFGDAARRGIGRGEGVYGPDGCARRLPLHRCPAVARRGQGWHG